MKNYKQKILIFSSLLLISLSPIFSPLQAQGNFLKQDKITEYNNNLNEVTTSKDISKRGLEDTIALIIKIALGTLGVIFITLMFLTGNDWMQAAGNEEKIKKAKERLQSLIVGLILILIAYALSSGFSGLLTQALLNTKS
jgi:uncharacterized membrane protein YwzB